MTSPTELVLVANARMPSQRAQSLQVAQVAAAFERAGARTTLLHARRVPTPDLPPGVDLFEHYAVPSGPRPRVEAVPCVDWIDRVPRRIQYLPARIQELTFARNAARRVRAGFEDAHVLSREAETGRALVSAGHPRTFIEVHRVPGGAARRRWLMEAAQGGRGVVAISAGVADDLVQLGVPSAAITVEHDGFEAARFDDLPARAEARELLEVDAGAVVAVYTGGLLAWKGVEVLIDAARDLPDVVVLIAGGMDAHVRALRARAAGLANVRLDGFQPPQIVASYLAAADMGIVPNRSSPAISARYTSPLKVFEAMAAGLPLVASDLPSLRELLTHGEDALMVAPDDPAALAAGIRLLADDPGLRAGMSERMRQRAPVHTWDARAHRLLDWMGGRAA